MNYRIKSIEINKEESLILVSRLADEIRKIDSSQLDKREQEIYVTSNDGLIDIWCGIQFNSDYRIVVGGIECTDRSVKADVSMVIAETGEAIEYKSELFLDEEIEKLFTI